MENLFTTDFENKLSSGKLKHYFRIYDDEFEKYKDKKINFLEIGINKGGDLQIWHKYFTNLQNMYAVDINEDCKKIEKLLPNTKIFIGDQGNIDFLENLKENIDDVDIILDDGGHQFTQQINSFNHLFLGAKYNNKPV